LVVWLPAHASEFPEIGLDNPVDMTQVFSLSRYESAQVKQQAQDHANTTARGECSRMLRLISDPFGLKAAINLVRDYLRYLKSSLEEQKTATAAALDRINYQMGEQLKIIKGSDNNLDNDISQIVASMGNINSSITQLFECLIELDRSQKALIARQEKL
jgi:hypothetical protein